MTAELVSMDNVQPSRVPRAEQQEGAVLGACLLDNSVIGEVMQTITPADMYNSGHRLIFEHLIELYRRHGSVDPMMLSEQLSSKGLGHQTGGYLYIAQLEEACLASSSAIEYAKIIREKSQLRTLTKLGKKLQMESAAESKPLSNLLEEVFKGLFEVTMGSRQRALEGLSTLAGKTADDIRERAEARRRGEVVGLPTGLTDLDKLIGGFQPGTLNILAARPSIGKTAFALDMTRRIIHRRMRHPEEANRVAFFSLEMGKLPLMIRFACAEARVSSDRVSRGYASDNELAAIDAATKRLEALPGLFDDCPQLSSAGFAMQARLLRLRFRDLGLFVIDGLWLMEHEYKPGSNRAQQIGETTRLLKQVAMEEPKVPILLLHQLNRESEKRGKGFGKDRKADRPSLADLRDTGAAEQDADLVMFLHRDRVGVEFDMHGNPIGGQMVPTQVIVAKHRNGLIGDVSLMFSLDDQRFESARSEGLFGGDR